MSKLVQLYVREIKAGNITLEDVPPGLKSKVEAALAEEIIALKQEGAGIKDN